MPGDKYVPYVLHLSNMKKSHQGHSSAIRVRSMSGAYVHLPPTKRSNMTQVYNDHSSLTELGECKFGVSV